MRLHAGIGTSDAGIRCRTLIAGIGMPGLRDLDFGRQVMGYLQDLDWPEEVVVEDLSCSAHLALHRLQELRPAKVVLVASAPRGVDPPGTLRHYQLDLTPPPPDEVHQGLVETLGGTPDLDHTLGVVRHWGGFPLDTIVIEVEPLDCSFGPGFSEELGECIDPILAIIREELGSGQETADGFSALSIDELTSPDLLSPALVDPEPEEPSSELLAMAEYVREHERHRRVEPYRQVSLAERLPLPSSIDVAVRNQPWGVGLGTAGDWYEFVPLPSGRIALVVGSVAARGVEAVATMSELRAAARAYALLDDDSPAHLVDRLDRLVTMTGLGERAELASMVMAPDTGEIRLSYAGQCPPLVLGCGATATYVQEGRSRPLGAVDDGGRPEGRVRLAAGSTLLVFTPGMVQCRARPLERGLARLAEAAGNGPDGLEELADHVLTACLGEVQRDDDALLLAIRLPLLAPSSTSPTT